MSHPEHYEQCAVIEWWRLQHPAWRGLLFASANGLYLGGTPRQRAVRWSLFEKSGGRAGVADLMLAIAAKGFHGLWIEVKAVKGGRLSQDQAEFIDGLSAMNAIDCLAWVATAMAIVSLAHVV